MATVEEVNDVITMITEGFEEQVVECLDDNRRTVIICICEQLYSGLDGNGKHLNPDYDNDPFFNEEGEWKGRNEDYKAWKNSITPPESSLYLGLSPRPRNVPNLFINGKFYSDIFATREQMELYVDVSSLGDGKDIVAKWGEDILKMGNTAVQYFNAEKLIPRLEEFYDECGYFE